MPAAERYLSHLNRIIHTSDGPPLVSDASGKTLQDFFDKIVGDRVRIGKTDWRGHGLPGLLMNLPNLNPSAKSALIKHVMDRWLVYAIDATEDPPKTETAELTAAVPGLNAQDLAESLADVHPADMSASQAEELPAINGNAIHRRDWFDRLTDWVAAVVSLWK